MNEDHIWGLKAGINRILEDGVFKIKARHLNVYSKGDIEVIEHFIPEWEKLGYLKIIKPYGQCAPNDTCVEMLQFIDQKSPIKGFLNWE